MKRITSQSFLVLLILALGQALVSLPLSKRSTPTSLCNNKNPQDSDPKPLVKTLGGGTSLMFEMARRMLVWDNPKQKNILPRWHPHSGISDVNPSFRTQSPIMNNQGYAGTIWRNVRKRGKPSLWRYALRTYNRMKELEEDSKNSVLKIERSNVHHEGAMLACAKLGLWQEALDIYRYVEETATTNPTQVATTRRRKAVCVTDNMLLSVVSACVRGSQHVNAQASLQERRAPLDAAVHVLLEMEEKHGLPLVARHLNPLASAYQSLGLLAEASSLIRGHLEDRTSGPEEENGNDPFNVNDVRAKDKASYSLLVKGALHQGDWENAVLALQEMTEAGLYPNTRNLNSWTETSERKSKLSKSWKKKREEYWLESVR